VNKYTVMKRRSALNYFKKLENVEGIIINMLKKNL